MKNEAEVLVEVKPLLHVLYKVKHYLFQTQNHLTYGQRTVEKKIHQFFEFGTYARN